MAFEKGNKLGALSKRGRGRKQIAKESLDTLEKIGINPINVSKDLIDGLVKNTEMKNTEKLQLLSIMTSLYKYSLLTRAEEIKLDELQQENEILEKENQDLKDKYLVADTKDLLETLKQEQE